MISARLTSRPVMYKYLQQKHTLNDIKQSSKIIKIFHLFENIIDWYKGN